MAKSKKSKGNRKNEDSGVVKSALHLKDGVTPFILTSWLFLVVFIGTFVVYFYQSAVRATSDLSSKKRKEKFHQRMSKATQQVISKLLVEWNPLWDRIVEYKTPVEELPRSVIYMSNHISFADAIFFSNAFVHPFTSVAKGDSFNTPVLGPIQKNNGTLPVFFRKDANGKWKTDKEGIKLLMKKAEEKLSMGTSILIFPEGTITKTGDVLDFKPGFFRLALRTYTPIIPVGTWGQNKAWPMGKDDSRGYSAPKLYAKPGRGYLLCGEPIMPFDFDFSTCASLQELIDDNIASNECPITAEDFEPENIPQLGRKLAENAASNELCNKLFEEFVKVTVEIVRDVVIELSNEAKDRYAEYEEEREKSAQRLEESFSKILNSVSGF